jgi:hypothetical protein
VHAEIIALRARTAQELGLYLQCNKIEQKKSTLKFFVQFVLALSWLKREEQRINGEKTDLEGSFLKLRSDATALSASTASILELQTPENGEERGCSDVRSRQDIV